MNYKISFCTVCMNRLHHLRQTLRKNIEDNLSYSELEFIVMDYSSTDGLSDWLKEEMSTYIDKGILTYYRYDNAKYFDRGHSRNMMFKLASGEIICNVDADNYLGENFTFYVNSVFNKENDIFLVPDTKKKYYYIRDVLGRFCARKGDFLSVRGYDEKMKGYGFEDDDLYNRLEGLGKKEVIIRDMNYLNAIRHENKDRIANEFFTNSLDSLYIHYESSKKSHVILLYKNGTCHKGKVIPNQSNTPAPAVLENLTWRNGTLCRKGKNIILRFSDSEDEEIYSDYEDFLMNEDKTFYKITNLTFRDRLPYELPLITNYSHFLYNKTKKELINNNGFGNGTVSKNFSLHKYGI